MGSRHNERRFGCKYVLFFFIQSFHLNAGQKRPTHPIQVILEFGDVAHWAKSFVSQCLQRTTGTTINEKNSVLCKVILLFALFLQLVSVPFHNRPHFKTISVCFSSVCLWLYNCLWERQRKRDKGAGFSSRSLENVQALYNYIETHGSTLFVAVLDVGNIFDCNNILK